MIGRTTGLIGLVALLGGCAGQTGVRPAAAAPTYVEGQLEDARARPVAGRPGPCPIDTASYRVRDLTVPWAKRRYLLPDGGLCRPKTAGMP